MMYIRKMFAVLKKQTMDTGMLRSVALQFLFYPLILLLFSDSENAKTAVLSALAPMFIGSSPMLTVNSIMREDKSTGTLKALMLASVRPTQYMAGVGLFLIMTSAVASLLIGLLGGFEGLFLILFVAIMLMGSVSTILLGSAFSMRGGYRANAVTFIVVLSTLNGMIPILETVYPFVYKVTQFWYTQQIERAISLLCADTTVGLGHSALIIGFNLVVFLFALVFSYRNNRIFD